MYGLGHVSPSYAIAEELLRTGCDVYFLTYAHGIKFLKAQHMKNVYDIGEPKHPPGIVQWKDLFEVNMDIIPLLRRINPAVVVVDGECDALFILKSLDIKLVFLTTTPYLNLDFGPWKPYREYGLAGLEHPDRILVHSLVKPKSQKFDYVFLGPLARKTGCKISKSKIVPIVIGSTTSKRIKDYGNRYASLLLEMGFEPLVMDNNQKGKGYVKDQIKLFSSATLIISHGGMALLEEISTLGKPSIILYDDENEEKKRNAIAAQKLGIGRCIDVTKPFDKDLARNMVESIIGRHSRIKQRKNGLPIAVREIRKMMK